MTTKTDVRDLFWGNTAAEMTRKYGRENLQQLGRDAGIRGSGASRIKRRDNVGVEMVQKVARAFGREPWQMLFPNLASAPGAELQSLVIRRLENAGAMGVGRDLMPHDQVVEHIAVSRDWVGMHVPRSTNPENLRVIAAIGDSMKPTLNDGDFVLVDTAVRAVDVDGIFVLRDVPNGLLIKRISRTADGPLITSDNPHAPPFGKLSDETDIVGRVVWAWNGRKL